MSSSCQNAIDIEIPIFLTGSNPVAPTTSEWTLLHSDFSLQKNQSFASPFLLIRKKARSAHLFSCKRSHDGSLSLPPFCESAFGTNISIPQLSLCFVIPPSSHKTYWVLWEPCVFKLSWLGGDVYQTRSGLVERNAHYFPHETRTYATSFESITPSRLRSYFAYVGCSDTRLSVPKYDTTADKS